MESLQKAVAKHLVKRRQEVRARPKAAPRENRPKVVEEQIDEAAIDEALRDEEANAAVDLSEDISLQAAIERARPTGKKKVLAVPAQVKTLASSPPPEAEISAPDANEDKPELPQPSNPPSPVKSEKLKSEIPNAYQLLLESAGLAEPEDPPKLDDDSLTSNPFGRKRKRPADAQVPEQRRSLRDWFTPGPDADAADSEDEPD